MAQRNSVALFLTILLAFTVVSCSSSRGRRHMGPTESPAEAKPEVQGEPELKKGMTAAAVRQAWGEPRDTIIARDDPDTQVWTYERRRLRGAIGGSQGARAVVERVIVTLTFKKDVLTHIAEKTL
jgi:hypothetical protein